MFEEPLAKLAESLETAFGEYITADYADGVLRVKIQTIDA